MNIKRVHPDLEPNLPGKSRGGTSRMQTVAEEATVRREAVPMSVLIVDDEQTVRDTCAAVAAQSGMKTIAVATAEEALEVLEHSVVDILLTDLKLPRANGIELLKLVHDMHPEVAVVVLTQYGTIESAVESNARPAPSNSYRKTACCASNCKPVPVLAASSASPSKCNASTK